MLSLAKTLLIVLRPAVEKLTQLFWVRASHLEHLHGLHEHIELAFALVLLLTPTTALISRSAFGRRVAKNLHLLHHFATLISQKEN